MKVAKNCVVSIDFKLINDQGDILDASAEGTPLIYLHGGIGIVPGLENELEGRAVGESFSVTVAPDEGFGESDPDLIHKVPLTEFPDPSQLQAGLQLQGTNEESGQVTSFIVREVTDEHVALDANHPLAGMTVRFEGVVQDIREATDEELSQGHPL